MTINCSSAAVHKTWEAKEWVQVSKETIFYLLLNVGVYDELNTRFCKDYSELLTKNKASLTKV